MRRPPVLTPIADGTAAAARGWSSTGSYAAIRRRVTSVLLIAPLLFMGALFVAPLAYLAVLSVSAEGGGFSLHAYRELWQPTYGRLALYTIQFALVATVAKEGEADPTVWELAAGGFRDMSRLAGQDVQMMGDVVSTNTQAVATLLALFRMQLAMLEAMLISRDDQKLAEFLRPAREARINWYQKYENGYKNGK